MTDTDSPAARRYPLDGTPDDIGALDRRDMAILVLRHFGRRLLDQARVVLPLAVWLVFFQWAVLRQPVADLPAIAGGLLAVVFGLMLFLEGLRVGLMPFGEALGRLLPARATLATVILVALLLGVGVTFAEPAIAALQAAGMLVDVRRAPYLYALLTEWSLPLVLAVGAGVGLAAILGILRLIWSWSLKPMIYGALVPTTILSIGFAFHPELEQLLGLAWDCGVATTGPVTVPLILALGIGVAHGAGAGDNPLAGFGIVTLAALVPIVFVLLLGLLAFVQLDPEAIVAAADRYAVVPEPTGFARTPWLEAGEALRAIVPLVLFLAIVLRWVLKGHVERLPETAYGVVLCLLGMTLFKIGLNTGLIVLGEQTGSLLPVALAPDDGPAFGPVLGVIAVVLFAVLLGMGATAAEPALNAFAAKVEELSDGAFRRTTLRMTVAVGVGLGVGVGVVKLLFGVPVMVMLIPAFLLAVGLTRISREDYANIAWDSGGVTTGPVTVPLVMAMGLGLAGAAGALQGFGVLALAYIGPIITMLIVGQWAEWQARRRRETSND